LQWGRPPTNSCRILATFDGNQSGPSTHARSRSWNPRQALTYLWTSIVTRTGSSFATQPSPSGRLAIETVIARRQRLVLGSTRPLMLSGHALPPGGSALRAARVAGTLGTLRRVPATTCPALVLQVVASAILGDPSGMLAGTGKHSDPRRLDRATTGPPRPAGRPVRPGGAMRPRCSQTTGPAVRGGRALGASTADPAAADPATRTMESAAAPSGQWLPGGTMRSRQLLAVPLGLTTGTLEGLGRSSGTDLPTSSWSGIHGSMIQCPCTQSIRCD